jgi:hypothetical protein
VGDSKNLEQRTRAVFIICPVKGISPDESSYLDEFVSGLEREGYSVHYPPDDTHQNDVIGLDICTQNRGALKKSREVRLYWKPGSKGSRFDTGMAFMAEKPFAIINGNAVAKTPDASFENFLLEFEGLYSSLARPARIDVPTDESICIICPEKVTLKEGAFLEEYISPFEIGEQRVYCPMFGAKKPDSRMFELLTEQRDAIRRAKEVHVLWSSTERDDLFGFGMAFMAEKPILLINRAEVKATPEKSFSNVLLALDKIYRKDD